MCLKDESTGKDPIVAPRSSRAIRSGLALISATLLTVGVASCIPSGQPTDLQFHLSKPEAIPYFRALVTDFNASQDEVRVTLDTSSNLQAGFLRGNPPDIALLNYNMEMARFMERGALSDLSSMDEAQRIRPDVQELVDQYATYPGRTSVLPYSVQAASVIYNIEIFDELGLEVPTTWDELIAVCDALLDAGVTPFYATFADPWTVGQGWFDYTVGGSVDVADFYDRMREIGTEVGPDSDVSFSSTFAEPVNRMTLLATQYVNADAASRGYGDGNLAFAQGRAAMYLQGPWAFSEIAKTDPDLRLGTFPLPVTDDPADLKVRVNIDLAAWIPEASRHQDEARIFLEYLFQQEIMDDYNAEFLGYGTTVEAADVTDPRIVEMRPYIDSGRFYQGPSRAIPLTIPVDNYLQGIVTGTDPAEVLETLDADWARLALRQ